MKRVIVTGAKGLLGEACCRLLSSEYEVIPLSRVDVDISDIEVLSANLRRLEFDYLINTAAMSGLEACLAEPELAKLVNSDAPRVMAEICCEKGAKMLHVSTDYVLDGRENVIHDEEVKTRVSGVYSETKLSGENAVIEACSDAVVGRVSWLFGYGRTTFVDQVIETANLGEEGGYICDKFSVPNFSDDLVSVMRDLLESDLTGVVHITNEALPESWYSYAEKVLQNAVNLGMLNDNLSLIDKKKLDEIKFFKEERPRYTAMRPKRLSEELNIEVRNWEVGLREYLRQKHENSLTNKRL